VGIAQPGRPSGKRSYRFQRFTGCLLLARIASTKDASRKGTDLRSTRFYSQHR